MPLCSLHVSHITCLALQEWVIPEVGDKYCGCYCLWLDPVNLSMRSCYWDYCVGWDEWLWP